MSKETQNSPGTEQPITFAGYCKTVLEELLVFVLFFSISLLIVLSIISVLTGIGNRQPQDFREPRPAKSCGWPPEWCKFLDQEQKTQRPFSILEQPDSKRSIPKYTHVLDYMLRP